MSDSPDPTRTTGSATAPGEPDRLLASVQRLTGVGIWSYDAAAGELWWSDQAKAIHGFESDETPGVADVVDQYAASDRDRVMERLTAALDGGEGFTVDVGLAGERTTERSVRLRCEPHSADDGTVVLHGVVRDVTDAKRQEQRIEILRRTSQQLRSASSKQEVAEIIADAAKNILGLVNTTVRLADEQRRTLRTVVATEECVERAGDRPDYPVEEETPAARTYRTGEPELHADHDETDDDHDRGALQSGLYVPIGDHGVLSAGDVVVDAFEAHDLEAASLLGQLGAEAITRIGWVRRSRAV